MSDGTLCSEWTLGLTTQYRASGRCIPRDFDAPTVCYTRGKITAMHLGWFLRYDAMLVISEASLMILLFRMACASSLQWGTIHHLLAGLWLGMAAWIAGSLLHASGSSLWQILLMGLHGEQRLFCFPAAPGLAARSAADLLVIASLGVLWVIPVSGFRQWPGRGDRLHDGRLCARSPDSAIDPSNATAAPAHAHRADRADGVMGDASGRFRFPASRARSAVPHATCPGRAVPQANRSAPSGAAAWLLKVPGNKSIGTAIFLHGNNTGAAHQPAALAMQDRLLKPL